MTSNSSNLRLAVVGAGLIGRRHVEIIGRCDGVSVSSVSDPSDEAKAFALERGLPWFRDLPDMLARDRPDGVIIATPNQLHVEQGLALSLIHI